MPTSQKGSYSVVIGATGGQVGAQGDKKADHLASPPLLRTYTNSPWDLARWCSPKQTQPESYDITGP